MSFLESLNQYVSFAKLDDFQTSGNWMAVLIVYIAAVLVVSSLAHFLVSRLEKNLIRRGQWPTDESLVAKFFLPVQIFLLSLTVESIPETTDTPVKVATLLTTVGKIGAIGAGVFICMRVIHLTTSIYLLKLRIDQPDNLRQRRLQTQVQFLKKLIQLFVIFVGLAALMFSFETFRRFGGSLLASAGLASVIIGFSAQKSLGNLIAGFQIAFTQPIRLGDAVLVEGEFGNIEEITLTYVVVRIWDLRRLVLPITYFLEKPFQNWTRTSADLLGTVLLWVDFSTPVDELKAELSRILKNSALWDKKVQGLQVVDTTDRAMQLRILVSAVNSGVAWDLRCEVRAGLIDFLQKKYPQALPKTRFVDEVVREPGAELARNGDTPSAYLAERGSAFSGDHARTQ